jgi:hypothetical protein
MEEKTLIRSAKENKELARTPGVYSIPCESCQVYTGQTGRFIEIMVKEDQRHIRLEQPDKSAVAEHSIERDHCIELQDTTVLYPTTRYMDHMIREAIEIELYRNNVLRQDGLGVTHSWTSLIHILKTCRKHRFQNSSRKLSHYLILSFSRYC